MKSVSRWVVLHGLGRVATRRWAKQGDLQAKLIADPAVRDNPYPTYEAMRARGTIYPTKIGYITTSHPVAAQVLRSDDFRTTSVSTSIPSPLNKIERRTRTGALHPIEPPSLLATDPPVHTRYRALVSSVFTARAVSAMREDVQVRADRLLDDIARDAHDEIDLVERYCSQLPVAVISDILGVAEADHRRVLEYGDQVAPSLDFALPYKQFRKTERALVEFDRWLGEHMEGLRANPGDDLMSHLIKAQIDGQHLSSDELRATAGLVLAAGFETTVNLLSSGTKLLLDHPEQLAVLRDDPALWSNAVDECLRFDPPVQLTGRVADADVELGGRSVPRDSFVVTILAAANRDPEVFTDPGRFDVARSNANKHLSFSGGRHFCLGAALARLEGEVGLRTLFERFPDLAAGRVGTRRKTRVLRGWASLPVRPGQPARRAVATSE